VVPTQEVRRYVKAHDAAGHVAIEMIDHDFHGSWLLEPALCARVALAVDGLCAAVAAGEAKGPVVGVVGVPSTETAVVPRREQQQQLQQEGLGLGLGQRQRFPLLRKGLASLAHRVPAGLRRRGRGSSGGSKGDGDAATVGAY
jgi:hypothetical protein